MTLVVFSLATRLRKLCILYHSPKATRYFPSVILRDRYFLTHSLQWLERLVGGRFPGRSTNEGEDLGELDINHVSNGFLTFSGIHMCTDRRVAAVIVVRLQPQSNIACSYAYT